MLGYTFLLISDLRVQKRNETVFCPVSHSRLLRSTWRHPPTAAATVV